MSKARIAMFTPLPPVQSGISLYAVRQINLLASHFDFTVYIDDYQPDERLFESDVKIKPAADFENDSPFDLILYHLGNAPCHNFLLPYLYRFPGMLILHDAWLMGTRLQQVFQNFEGDLFREEMIAIYGDKGDEIAEVILSGLHNETFLRYTPYIELQVRSSYLTVVHDSWLANQIEQTLQDSQVSVIPLLLFVPVPDSGVRQNVRESLGIDQKTILFGSFGYLTPEKGIEPLLQSFAWLHERYPDSRCLLAGGKADHLDLESLINKLDIADSVILTGRLDDEPFRDHMIACDALVQLRWPTRRETSGVIIAAMNIGIPLVVSDLANMGDYPAEAMLRVPVNDSGKELKSALIKMVEDKALRQTLAEAAKEHILAKHSDSAVKKLWLDNIELAMAKKAKGKKDLSFLPKHLKN
jgi:glycosyltransferase involved in cell wall biosynthesis